MDISRLIYDQNWNIGFCALSKEQFISAKNFGKIEWMKHSYKDRWFADPFIFKVTNEDIIVFVEECNIENPKGILCELVIDKKSKKLKHRYVLLELDTHLSYPFIINSEGKTYVCPENGASGCLNIYEYDNINHKLIKPQLLLKEAVADASIFIHKGKTLMIATKFPETQENAFVYEAENFMSKFNQCSKHPFATTKNSSRPGGDWISIGDKVFRPAQNCEKMYGGSLKVMSVSINGNQVSEYTYFEIFPFTYKYNLGLHTINFNEGYCVIDSCGYLHPICGRIYKFMRYVKRKLL